MMTRYAWARLSRPIENVDFQKANMGTRPLSIKQSSAINLAGAVVPVLITLITLPLLLPLVGEARHGVLLLVWTLVGYLGVMDMGLVGGVLIQLLGGALFMSFFVEGRITGVSIYRTDPVPLIQPL